MKVGKKITGKLGIGFDTKNGGRMITECWEKSVENW